MHNGEKVHNWDRGLRLSLQYPQGFEADFTSLIHFYGKKTTTATNKFFTNTDITINATF